MGRFVTDFITIAYNHEVADKTSALAFKKRKCIVAAAAIESKKGWDKCESALLIQSIKIDTLSLTDLMKSIDGLSKRAVNEISNEILNKKLKEGILQKKNSILCCDFNYKQADLKEEIYHVDESTYRSTVEQYIAEVMENDESDETYAMTWILKQSGELSKVFSESDRSRIEEKYYNYVKESFVPGYDLKGVDPDVLHSREVARERFYNSKFMIGLSTRLPLFQKKKVIFIATEKYFSNAEERFADVKRTLEEEHVEYEIEKEGQVPQIRVDGTVYELIPDAIQAKYLTVHGVKLRKVCG